jgi:ABC-type polysaccharide/polyol phosphate transport system ATPase subunit
VSVIEAQAVSKQFLLRHNASVELKVRFLSLLHRDRRQSVEEFWALRNVSLRIDRGEAVGLVGRNGSGKSTLLKLIAAIHRPTAGRLLVARNAQISSMIELGVGFHPELTGRENVFLNAAIHGLTRTEIEEIYDAIVEYSGLEHFIDVPIKNYSSGMYMRLGFAIAANLNPDILLLDEIFAVGDAEFQQRCMATLRKFMEDGKTIIFVSHAAPAIRAICRRVCVLEQSELVFDGDLESGLEFYEGQAKRVPSSADASSPAPPQVAPAAEAGLERPSHETDLERQLQERGLWEFETLRHEGLTPQHYLLDIGSNSSAAPYLAPFMNEHHYFTLGIDDIFELNGAIPSVFDLVMANSLFPSLPFNVVARCIAGIVRRLEQRGRFYATWYENPNPADFDPIVHPGGITTYPDREPYHYPLSLIALVCDSVGGKVERVAAAPHPRGESLLCITRRD